MIRNHVLVLAGGGAASNVSVVGLKVTTSLLVYVVRSGPLTVALIGLLKLLQVCLSRTIYIGLLKLSTQAYEYSLS